MAIMNMKKDITWSNGNNLNLRKKTSIIISHLIWTSQVGSIIISYWLSFIKRRWFSISYKYINCLLYLYSCIPSKYFTTNFWTLYGKCPKAEFFLVRTFPYSDWIYEANLRIHSEYEKIRAKKNVFEHFSRSWTFTTVFYFNLLFWFTKTLSLSLWFYSTA